MKSFATFLIAFAGLFSIAVADIGLHSQCGGVGYGGETVCADGTVCTFVNDGFSQCLYPLKVRDSDPLVGYASLGHTTGGTSGPTTRVSTLAALKSAVAGSSPKTVILTTSLVGNDSVLVGSNTSLLGAKGVSLQGIGFQVLDANNVIIRNFKISKVLASAGDAIGVQASSNVWIDHVELSSDLDHGKDYYDGLLDITHGCTDVSISWSYLHDHYKASLVGHSDDNGQQDKSITVTYHHNYFARLNSRVPSLRYGHAHVYNNYYDHVVNGVDTRDGAQALVENNIFIGADKPVFSTDNGYAVARGNDFGGASDSAPAGTFTNPPYNYTLSTLADVKSQVPTGAGANLSF